VRSERPIGSVTAATDRGVQSETLPHRDYLTVSKQQLQLSVSWFRSVTLKPNKRMHLIKYRVSVEEECPYFRFVKFQKIKQQNRF
jgi:hypothetical protein